MSDKAKKIKTTNKGREVSAVDHRLVYRARMAASKSRYRTRPEGVISRIGRLIKGIKEARLRLAENPYPSAENRRELYSAVFRDTCAPLFEIFGNAVDVLWDFLCSLGYDFLEIIVFIINAFIKLFYYAGSGLLFLRDRIMDFFLWVDMHKRSLVSVSLGVAAPLIFGVMLVSSMSAYEYSYYGRVLGTTKTKEEVYDVIEVLGDKLSENAGANISLDVERDISFKHVYGLGLNIDTPDDILNTLTYMSDIRIEAAAIFIDGVQVAVVENQEIAQNIIDSVKQSYLPEKAGYEYTSVSLGQDVAVKDVGVVLSDLWNPSVVENYLKTGSARPLSEGEATRPLLTVYASATVATEKYTAFGKTYKTDSSLYIDEVVLETEGKEGVTLVKATAQLINGIEVSYTTQSTEVISNPVNAVYRQGSKPLPERVGTGTWIFPLKSRYTISSKYGYRETGIAGASTNHKGVDLACASGTPIYATDGGVVTYSGYKGNMGYLVIIDHGELYESYYAHCSKLLVSVGEHVYQGQNIALVGSTGNSTGPHLHFEVHYKGSPFNPMTLF